MSIRETSCPPWLSTFERSMDTRTAPLVRGRNCDLQSQPRELAVPSPVANRSWAGDDNFNHHLSSPGRVSAFVSLTGVKDRGCDSGPAEGWARCVWFGEVS